MKFSEKSNISESRYFIAILPTDKLQQRIDAIKNDISQKYHTRGAFRSPAHITLQMPFILKDKKLNGLEETLQNFSKKRKPFNVQLYGFEVFEPRVLFIKVIKSQELSKLQAALKRPLMAYQIFNSSYKNHGFTPHITVAFRDLKKQHFYEAWQAYKSVPFDESFLAEGLTLLKHDGKIWKEYAFFSFGE